MPKFSVLMTFFLFLSLSLSSVFSEENSFTAESGTLEAVSSKNQLFKWAWDVHEDLHKQYPATMSSDWISPESPLRLVLGGTEGRDKDNFDEYRINFMGSFLPLLIDFSQKNDFSVPYITMGFYARYNFLDIEGHTQDVPGIPFLISRQAQLESNINILSVGFSSMFCFPEQGMQIVLSLGHQWRRTEIEFDDMYAMGVPNPPFPPGRANPKVKIVQHESGFELYNQIRINTDKRNFLTGVEIETLGYWATGTRETKGKAEYPPSRFALDITRNLSTTETDAIATNIFTKILSFPVWQRQSPPIFPYYNQKAMASLAVQTGIAHRRMYHGYDLSLGFRINLFENLFITYTHQWTQKNDAPDSDTFMVEFQVGLAITPKK